MIPFYHLVAKCPDIWAELKSMEGNSASKSLIFIHVWWKDRLHKQEQIRELKRIIRYWWDFSYRPKYLSISAILSCLKWPVISFLLENHCIHPPNYQTHFNRQNTIPFKNITPIFNSLIQGWLKAKASHRVH